jgi:hypothetical protein
MLMPTIRFTTEIGTDGTIRLPEGVELPPGEVDVTVVPSAENSDPHEPPRTSLADWADQYAEHWGQQLRAVDVSSFTGRSF